VNFSCRAAFYCDSISSLMSETIPYLNLLYLLPLLIISGWLYYSWSGKKWELGFATLRMVAQLITIGYLLIFLFQNETSWMGALILLVMIVMSTVIAIRPLQKKGKSIFLMALLSIALSGTLTLALVTLGVLNLDPLYQPKIVIPLAGMIYSNSMNTISLSGERYFMEQEHSSTREARGKAYQAALIPQINSFLAVGIVSLPGMMTGQILSGISPLIAVRYQIMVMAMILGSAGLSAGLFLWVVSRRER